jgi:Cu(I)-responsive transcriptional regulator
MNISQAAEATDLPAKTIRYYEEIGLVTPARSANGYRAFAETDVHKLRFLARSRALGFSIDDCRALLALYEDDKRASAEVKAIARRHLDEIATKIADLRALEATLGHLVETCAGDDKPNCPILADLGR